MAEMIYQVAVNQIFPCSHLFLNLNIGDLNEEKKLLLTSAIVLLSILLLAIGFLIMITVTDYIPEEIEEIEVINNPQRILHHQQPFSVVTFNIGYGGMDRDQDFFMDGGKMSRSSSEAQTQANLTAVTSLLIEAKADFYLLQEIDTHSSRSYHINQADAISQALPGYSTVFAYNYKTLWSRSRFLIRWAL